MRAKYIKVNRNKQQSPKTKKKQTNISKTPKRQTLQTCRNIKKNTKQ